ncbi:MAG: c-type cytochrome domain-containing protein [Bdellovibrionales bacterium]
MGKKKFILLLSFLASCSSEHSPELIDLEEEVGAAGVQTLLDAPEQVVFSDVQKHVLSPSCVECHNGSKKADAKVNLESFKSLSGQGLTRNTVIPFSPERSLLFEVLLIPSGSRHMPPVKKKQLSKDQINLVFQWIKNGAKTDVTQKVERPKTLSELFQPYFNSPETIDYGVVKEHVFDNSCTKCHSNDEETSDWEAVLLGQNMTSYKDLFKDEASTFSVGGIVKGQLFDEYKEDEAGNLVKVDGSKIFESIVLSQSMPPAKDGYKPMDSLRVKLLRLWILNCAVEDYEAIKENDSLIESALEKKSSKVRSCKQ